MTEGVWKAHKLADMIREQPLTYMALCYKIHSGRPGCFWAIQIICLSLGGSQLWKIKGAIPEIAGLLSQNPIKMFRRQVKAMRWWSFKSRSDYFYYRI